MELGCSCYEVAWGQGRNEGPGDVVGADLVRGGGVLSREPRAHAHGKGTGSSNT